MRRVMMLAAAALAAGCAGRPWRPPSASGLAFVLARTEGTTYRLERKAGKPVLAAVRREKRTRADFGLRLREITKAMARERRLVPYRGLFVVSVVEGGAAARAGLLPGDVLLSLDGTELHYRDQFETLRRRLRPGDGVTLVVARGSRELKLRLVPTAREEEETVREEVPLRVPPAPAGRPRIGLALATLPAPWSRRVFGAEGPAALVTTVEVGSPAHRAGLLPGDRVVAVGGRPVGDAAAAQEALRRAPAGRPLKVEVVRGRERYAAEVVPAEYRHERRFTIPFLLDVEETPARLDWTVGPFGIVARYRRVYAPGPGRGPQAWRRFSFLWGAFAWAETPAGRRVRVLWFIRFAGDRG